MLIISRKSGESFTIGEEIEITVFDIKSDKIRIGINAPSSIPVFRKEMKEIREENVKASKTITKEKLKELNQYLAESFECKIKE